MNENRKIYSLLKLLDDDSPVVQEAVTKELIICGSEVDTVLADLPPGEAMEHRRRIQELLGKTLPAA